MQFILSLSLHCTSHFECNLSSLSLHCTSYFECNFGLEFLCGLIQFFLLEADSNAPWTSAKDGSQGACFISTSTSPSVEAKVQTNTTAGACCGNQLAAEASAGI
jgi:hypothetical protein